MLRHIAEIAEVDAEQMRAEVTAAPVRYAWSQERDLPGFRLRVSLPHSCSYDADYYGLRAGDAQRRRLVTSNFSVHEKLQKQGIGTRLFRAAVFVAQERGAQYSSAMVDNPVSLLVRRSIFGEDNMVNTMYGDHTRLSVDQAMGVLAARNCLLIDYTAVMTVSSLKRLDTTGWEVPVETSFDELYAGSLCAKSDIFVPLA